jgi:CRP-like cAMP-binding protein
VDWGVPSTLGRSRSLDFAATRWYVAARRCGLATMIKKLFGRADAEPKKSELTTEDLIVLERWDEAIAQLQSRLTANPNDLHANLKLAEVYVQAGKPQLALDRFLFVAESYTDDGFYDKAIALLTKVVRLAPGEGSIEGQIRKAQQLKTMEHRSTLALEGLRAAQEARRPEARLSLIEAQRMWQALSTTEVALNLPGEQLRRLFAFSKLVEPDRGRILAEAGAADEVLYLFGSGEGEAVYPLPGGGEPVLLRIFQCGDVIGDRALFEHQPWPATYRVTSPARLFRLDRVGLEQALQGNPDPRQFLDALRARRSDYDVAASVRKLVSSSA